MAPATKVTFTLDRPTVRLLNRTSRTLAMPKSRVVREAVREYAERLGKLPEAERLRLLAAFDEVVAKIPATDQAVVESELKQVRAARRNAGRASGRPK
jgi:ribbon-helix-helix CopG family protein